jgi:hypothetical protein
MSMLQPMRLNPFSPVARDGAKLLAELDQPQRHRQAAAGGSTEIAGGAFQNGRRIDFVRKLLCMVDARFNVPARAAAISQIQ